jgi:hypothetical protein
MKVIIDGIRYVPFVDVSENADAKEKALNARLDNGTVKDYLARLLVRLWQYRESFDAKRPFGESDWYCSLIDALIDCGYIQEETEELAVFGTCRNYDGADTRNAIQDLILYAFYRA